MLVTRGRVLAQRFYDIADEVDLKRAAGLVQSLSRRPEFVRSARQIKLPSPPLEMSLGPRMAAGFSSVDVLVRLYDVGALAVTFAVDMPCPLDGEALIAFGSRFLGGDDQFIAPGRAIAQEILAAVGPACSTRNVSAVTEEYTVFVINATDPKTDADTLPDQLDVARLLLGETGPISKRERSQQSHAFISYSPDELVVVDWNSALVYAPPGTTDISDLLELASMQLLELRAYDDIVGRSMTHLYETLGERRESDFRQRRYLELSREVMRLFVDVTEMTDRIEHSLTTLGDSWLARVHQAALAEFEVGRWSRLVKDKLEVLRQINELLVDQITSRKSYRIEFAIVLLIVLEIVLALLKVM